MPRQLQPPKKAAHLQKNNLRQKTPRKAAFFRSVLDSSPNWEYQILPDGRMGYISPACEQISGYAPEEFEQNVGLLETILTEEDRQKVAGHFPEDGKGEAKSLEFRILTRNGEMRWIRHRCRTIYSADGANLGCWAENQDITADKQRIESEKSRVERRLEQLNQQLITIQEEERQRISQDLHDDTGQGMTAILLRLNAILSLLGPEQQEARQQLEETIRIVEALMNQVRTMAYQLRPPSLDSVPLSKALEALCSSFGQNAGLRIDYSSDEDLPPIPNLQATALYRLVQEGLNNAIKYAQASTVWINLDYIDGEVSLSVEDNGKGFDLNQVGVGGMGLLGLQERFRLLNGGLEIESAPGEGTQLYGYLPLANHSL
ncbi:MAG TPA: histidine kinase [Anaerolineaceae bacterium]|nr:histidine kinase [Anaerolineaceae bacterium]